MSASRASIALSMGLALTLFLSAGLRAEDATPEPPKPPAGEAPPAEAPEPPKPEPPKPDMIKDAEATQKALLSKRLSVDLKGVPLQDALEMLATAAGVGLAIDGHIEGEKLRETLDLKLERASVYAVLRWIFLKRDLAWAVRGHDVLVAPPRFIDADVANRQNEFVAAAEDAWEKEAGPKLAQKLSVDVADVSIENVARIVAERAGVGLVWTEGIEKARAKLVSLKVEGAPLSDLLDRLAASADLHWGLEAEAIVFSTP